MNGEALIASVENNIDSDRLRYKCSIATRKELRNRVVTGSTTIRSRSWCCSNMIDDTDMKASQVKINLRSGKSMLYSLLGTCKALGINPFEWLKYVLHRIHTHPMSRIKELLPQYYKAAIAVRS